MQQIPELPEELWWKVFDFLPRLEVITLKGFRKSWDSAINSLGPSFWQIDTSQENAFRMFWKLIEKRPRDARIFAQVLQKIPSPTGDEQQKAIREFRNVCWKQDLHRAMTIANALSIPAKTLVDRSFPLNILEAASDVGNTNLVRWLLFHFQPLPAKPLCRAFEWACVSGRLETAQLLLSKIKSPDQEIINYAFNHALANGHLELAIWMLKSCKRLTIDKYYVARHVGWQCKIETAKWLTENVGIEPHEYCFWLPIETAEETELKCLDPSMITKHDLLRLIHTAVMEKGITVEQATTEIINTWGLNYRKHPDEEEKREMKKWIPNFPDHHESINSKIYT